VSDDLLNRLQDPELYADDPIALERIKAIVGHPSYARADLDTTFLAQDNQRSNRLMLEYEKVRVGLKAHNVHSTIVIFGSARILEPAKAQEQLAAARRALDAAPDEARFIKAVRAALKIVEKSHYYDIAREYGRMVTAASAENGGYEFVVTTGGGPGVMEAGNRGAADMGGMSIGLNITLPHEQLPNPYITPGLCFQFRYFALRKMHFLRLARALVAFPGGYGTLDEIFDTLCLIQTGKMPRVPIVLVGEGFWRGALNLEFLAEEGVISDDDAELVSYAETAAEIRDVVESWYEERGGTAAPMQEDL